MIQNMFKDNPAKCCGCSACFAICPTDAIQLQKDHEGFLYPVVNKDKCVECKKCLNVCPVNSTSEDTTTTISPEFYALKHQDENTVLASTSGGAFTALSDYVLSKNGVVYGVVYDDNFKAIHVRTENAETRDKMRVSKYLQSELNDTFIKVKEDLKSGILVLFTGTPCQVAGLRKYLNSEYDNLLLIDFVCHGVPSPMIFAEHIHNIERVKKAKVTKYLCRSKVKGWHRHVEYAEFNNGKCEYNTPLLNEYKYLFHSLCIHRPSCYECKFTNLARHSDITMGDFWGIEKHLPNWDDPKGVSLLLVNSEKGKKIFNSIEHTVYYCKSQTYGRQPRLEYPAQRPSQRELFWQLYQKHGYKYIAAKYGRNNIKTRTKYIVKKLLGKI